MALFVGLAEFAIFAVFAGVCVMLVLTLIFAVLNFGFLTVGLAFNIGSEEIVGLTVATMVVWASTLVVGGLCSAAGTTNIWDTSPFGWLQTSLRSSIRPWFAPEPHHWGSDFSGMWATFWSYTLVSLLLSILIVLVYVAVANANARAKMNGPA